jgi:hypothetical protein
MRQESEEKSLLKITLAHPILISYSMFTFCAFLFSFLFFLSPYTRKKKKFKFSSQYTQLAPSTHLTLRFIIWKRKKFTSFLVQVQGLFRCIGAALPTFFSVFYFHMFHIIFLSPIAPLSRFQYKNNDGLFYIIFFFRKSLNH